MGYLIVSRVSREGERLYVGWMPDDRPIAKEMQRWLVTGETLEVLEYVQQKTPMLIQSIYDWREHFGKQEQEGQT